LIVEVGIADDHPLEAERVRLAVDRGAAALGNTAKEFLRIVLRLAELTRRERLEDQCRVTRRLERAFRVEGDGRGREREKPLGRWSLQLLAAEEDVAEPRQGWDVSSGC
jgi:hypothetical protein